MHFSLLERNTRNKFFLSGLKTKRGWGKRHETLSKKNKEKKDEKI